MLQVSRDPAYPRVLGLVKTRPDAVFLDIGSFCTYQLIPWSLP